MKNIKVLFILALLGIGILFMGCTQTKEAGFTKTIQVKNVYPRTDAYLNHYPPYVVTTDGEIYDVDGDVLWSKFDAGNNYTVKFYPGALTERSRTGSIVEIL